MPPGEAVTYSHYATVEYYSASNCDSSSFYYRQQATACYIHGNWRDRVEAAALLKRLLLDSWRTPLELLPVRAFKVLGKRLNNRVAPRWRRLRWKAKS